MFVRRGSVVGSVNLAKLAAANKPKAKPAPKPEPEADADKAPAPVVKATAKKG